MVCVLKSDFLGFVYFFLSLFFSFGFLIMGKIAKIIVDSFVFQAHLLGVFDNVKEAEFHTTEYDKIIAVISQEGEKLPVFNAICIFSLEL